MHRRGVFALPLILAARGVLRANAANGDPRKERLFAMFISPCCWRENLLVHHSPKADELRAEIEGLIAAGRTDEEIKQGLIDRYSRRVLSLPDGVGGELLSWAPVAAVVAGLVTVGVFMKRSLRTLAACVMALLCTASMDGELRKADPPALAGSGMPFLTTGPDGTVVLAWTEPAGERDHALRFARWNGASWSAPETIAQGGNWFVNWADFGSLTVLPDGSMLAHWLSRAEGGSKFGYGIRIARRDPDRPVWRQVHGMSMDEKVDYAGFLTFVPGSNVAIYLSPPDDKSPPASHDDEHSHRKTARFIQFRGDGSVASDTEIDRDVCSCCQTAIGKTRSGWIAAYRDHLPGEIRDISVVRFIDGAWTTPRTLHADGWKINGCPTDGPALSVQASRVGIVWLTRAGDQPKVQLALSSDDGRTFGRPVRIDSGNPVGRPAITAFDQTSYLVTWLEKTASGPVEIRMRRVSLDGTVFAAHTVTQAPVGRASGFPKAVVAGEQIILAWRDDRVRAVLLKKSQLKDQK